MNVICLVTGHDWAIVIRGCNVFSVCSRCGREEGKKADRKASAVPERGIDAERSHDETKD